MVPIRIFRLDPRAKLPERATRCSVGCDIFALEDYTFYPGDFFLVRTGLVIKAEPPIAVFIFPRSSLYKNKKLIMPNSAGIIDFDYCGLEDEIKIPLLNIGDDLVYIKSGEKIAQMVFVNIAFPLIVEVDKIEERSRGGFGSTGGYF